MSPLDRREIRRQQTHQQLLDAAREVFSQKGYHEASILDITEAADVSKRTFYLHFKDKDELVHELAYLSFEEVRIKIETEKEHQSQAMREGFNFMVRTLFKYAADNLDLMQIVVGRGGSLTLNSMTREYLAAAMTRNVVDNPMCNFNDDSGIAREVLANAEAGMIFQLLCWWVQNDNPHTPTEMADMCTAILFDSGDNFYIEEENVIAENAV